MQFALRKMFKREITLWIEKYYKKKYYLYGWYFSTPIERAYIRRKCLAEIYLYALGNENKMYAKHISKIK